MCPHCRRHKTRKYQKYLNMLCAKAFNCFGSSASLNKEPDIQRYITTVAAPSTIGDDEASPSGSAIPPDLSSSSPLPISSQGNGERGFSTTDCTDGASLPILLLGLDEASPHSMSSPQWSEMNGLEARLSGRMHEISAMGAQERAPVPRPSHLSLRTSIDLPAPKAGQRKAGTTPSDGLRAGRPHHARDQSGSPRGPRGRASSKNLASNLSSTKQPLGQNLTDLDRMAEVIQMVTGGRPLSVALEAAQQRRTSSSMTPDRWMDRARSGAESQRMGLAMLLPFRQHPLVTASSHHSPRSQLGGDSQGVVTSRSPSKGRLNSVQRRSFAPSEGGAAAAVKFAQQLMMEGAAASAVAMMGPCGMDDDADDMGQVLGCSDETPVSICAGASGGYNACYSSAVSQGLLALDGPEGP